MSRVAPIYHLKCPVFTNYETCKETGMNDPYVGKNSRQHKLTERAQMSDLTEKDFQAVILNMFNELKETI